MANTILNTRIQLRYDTYKNWTTNNPVLLAGEVAVTTVQSAQAPVSQVPAILFKVGDGTNNFNALNWASAIAADVYPWAKASVKPTYQASEIEGLEDYISGQIGQTPNITIGTVETLPAGSDATASITGQTPNLVLNLGIPQGLAGAGVPPTEGVPTDYLLSPAGWVAPPSGGDESWELINEVTTTEQVHSVVISQDGEGQPISLKNFLLKAFATSEFGTPAFIKLSGKNRYINILSFPKSGVAPSSNYMNSATFAGGLMLAGNGHGGNQSAHVGAFINANSDPPELPITSVEITATAAGTLFDAGSVFTLYGVRQ